MINLFDILKANHVAMIGSEQGNDVVLEDTDVSARHCQITKIEDGKYLIVDLGSATGTFVNNQKIEKEFITDNDFISVGNTIFQIRKKIKESEIHETVKPDLPSPLDISKETTIHSPALTNHKKIIVYFLAAPEDENVCKAIDKHLAAVRFNSALPIEIYGDFKIPAGDDIETYKKKLFEADIVLAFISVDFINNNACYERTQKVIVKYNKHETILLPILVRNCMWKATPFANLPLLPKNLQPLNNKQFWNSEDDALTTVVTDIYNSINEFTNENTHEQPVKNMVSSSGLLKVDWRREYNSTVFWKRVAAYVLDVLIVYIPLFILIFLFAYLFAGNENAIEQNYYDDLGNVIPQNNDNYVAGQVIGIILGFLSLLFYGAFFESSRWHATPGKLILKLYITDGEGRTLTFGKAFLRNFIKLLMNVFSSLHWSITPIYYLAQIGFFISKKKFIHDQLSDTIIGEKLN